MRGGLFALLFVLVMPCPFFCGKDQLSVSPTTTSRSSFAALDDVRLLANGLLQLGQSMREFVQKTKEQITDITQKLNIFDHSFYQLSVLAREIKEEEEELKKTTVVLKANNEEIKGFSVQIISKVDTILQDKSQLQNKVEGLEEKLTSMSQGLVTTKQMEEINTFKNTIYSQEQSVTELLKAVQEQSKQLNQQRLKIKMLEEKLATNIQYQETIENMPDISNTADPMFPTNLTSEAPNNLEIMNLPSDCSELFNQGERLTGVYTLRPNKSESFMAFCDMSLGETVIQRRRDGLVHFDQTWEKYENGFGDLEGEFWLGLRQIHSLAAQGNSVLHIQLEEWKQGKRFMEYRFHLDGPESNYTIHLTHLSGALPDLMSNHTDMKFSTKDRDNDNHPDYNCARDTGGWWFNACGDINLNGKYLRPKRRSERKKGIQWRSGTKASYSLKFTQISVRRPT